MNVDLKPTTQDNKLDDAKETEMQRHKRINRRVGYIAAFLAISTLALPFVMTFDSLFSGYEYNVTVEHFIVAFWVIAPAVWLFYEWFYLIIPALQEIKEGSNRDYHLEIFKHQQSIVRAMWAAFLIVVLAEYQIIPLTDMFG